MISPFNSGKSSHSFIKMIIPDVTSSSFLSALKVFNGKAMIMVVVIDAIERLDKRVCPSP